jgi:hypothetical protein
MVLDRDLRIGAVDLVEIDEIGAEPAQAVVDFTEDRLARQSGAVRPRPHPAIDLGREHDVLAADEILQRAADDFLRRAVRIDIGGVEEIDAELERLLDQRATFFLIERPRMWPAIRNAVGHATDAQPRHAETGLAEFHIIHVSSSAVVSSQTRRYALSQWQAFAGHFHGMAYRANKSVISKPI